MNSKKYNADTISINIFIVFILLNLLKDLDKRVILQIYSLDCFRLLVFVSESLNVWFKYDLLYQGKVEICESGFFSKKLTLFHNCLFLHQYDITMKIIMNDFINKHHTLKQKAQDFEQKKRKDKKKWKKWR